VLPNMKTKLLLIVEVLLCIALAACSSYDSEQQQGSSKPYTVWFTNPSEYHTNVLSVAQAETPFIIILPSYLPEDISHTPHLGGRAKSEFDDTYPVTIIYKNQRTDNDLINIDEYNLNITTLPSSKEISYLRYLDTQVLEQASSGVTFAGDGKTTIPTAFYEYSWNRNGLHYDVKVTDHDRDEARKIIESMIK
jgi:hypothetical protein